MKPDKNAAFGGSIPENYDRYLGPSFFEPYANDMAARLDPARHRRVLEIACGTGIVTRCLRERLASDANLVATDLNPAMLAFAQKTPVENVTWREADATTLPFPDGSFDAVVCQFGVMFFPDKETAFRETHRVLSAGGVFLFNVWDSLEQNPAPRTAHETIHSFFDRDPPNFYETPFGFHDPDLIRRLLRAAGFEEIEISAVTLPCRNRSAAEFAIGLVRGNPVATAIEERGIKVDTVLRAVEKRSASALAWRRWKQRCRPWSAAPRADLRAERLIERALA
ncbi:MAG: class I SAM-dependent methyltransferase [Verrucomicrobiota bacterium]|nr:class I SAM-dependent methyltransferase [Verrucomicrobiota bacterium]